MKFMCLAICYTLICSSLATKNSALNLSATSSRKDPDSIILKAVVDRHRDVVYQGKLQSLKNTVYENEGHLPLRNYKFCLFKYCIKRGIRLDPTTVKDGYNARLTFFSALSQFLKIFFNL